MPLRLGLGEYWLVRRRVRARARRDARSCVGSPPCRASARISRSVTGAWPRRLLGEGDPSQAEREVAEALRVLDGARGARGGVARLRCGGACRRGARAPVESRGLLGRGAAALDQLAAGLKDEGDLQQSFLPNQRSRLCVGMRSLRLAPRGRKARPRAVSARGSPPHAAGSGLPKASRRPGPRGSTWTAGPARMRGVVAASLAAAVTLS